MSAINKITSRSSRLRDVDKKNVTVSRGVAFDEVKSSQEVEEIQVYNYQLYVLLISNSNLYYE